MWYNFCMDNLNAAYRLAEKAHEGQVDKIGVPYFHHVRAVSEIVQRMPSYSGLSKYDKNNAIIASLLHDIVEDTSTTLLDLYNFGFNETITNTVELLTYDKSVDRITYYEKIIPHPVARLVKTGDLAHNNLYARRVVLPQEHQDRLAKKYEKAIQIIVTDEDYETFMSVVNKTR